MPINTFQVVGDGFGRFNMGGADVAHADLPPGAMWEANWEDSDDADGHPMFLKTPTGTVHVTASTTDLATPDGTRYTLQGGVLEAIVGAQAPQSIPAPSPPTMAPVPDAPVVPAPEPTP